MHVILGKGQLGTALRNRLMKDGQQPWCVWKPRYPEDYNPAMFQDLKNATIWNCVGFGSVEDAKRDFQTSLRVNLELPQFLMKNLDESSRLVLFSSDYAVEAERSEYAFIKSTMEALYNHMNLKGTKRMACLRVTSLYGPYRPLSCFPGKLLKNYPAPCELKLPNNHVVPTPVDWLADELVRNLGRYIGEIPWDVCPGVGTVSLLDWGRMILGDEYTITAKGLDESRPKISHMDCTTNEESWEDLWKVYGKSTLAAAHMHLKAGATSTSTPTQALFNGT
jgi:dTDP-4-dehydrorhamnose reductase